MASNAPKVTWAGVVVRLDDGTVVATEFAGGFITADVHTLHPWNGGYSKTQDEVRITVQGNGRVWREGANYAPPAAPRAVEGRRAIEGEVL